MARLEVHKFGGTSVAGAERLKAAAQKIAAAQIGSGALPSGQVPSGELAGPGVGPKDPDLTDRTSLVVVTSAMAGVTDALLAACAAAATGDHAAASERIAQLRELHDRTLAALSAEPNGLKAQLDQLLDDVAAAVEAVYALHELTPRSKDRIVAAGEKLAVRLLSAALRAEGLDARPLDADTFLETNAQHGTASPLPGATDAGIRATLLPLLAEGAVPVVTGFIGRAGDGSITTLGRSGSDFTATIIAGALPADEVTIWTDVDGVYSADPRTVPDARIVPQLNYREAAELAYYGGKVLHPRTIIPVVDRGIPIWIRSSLENGANGAAPNGGGTLVDGRSTPGSHPVKCISAIRGHALVSVEGKGMAGVPGVASRVFQSLASEKISVTMISQSSSEASITMAIPARDALAAERSLKREFRTDITNGIVDDVVVRPGISILAAVGLGMAHTPGIAGRVMNALGKGGLNVRAIAQGSSELNISVAVDEQDADDAIRRLHHAFGLHRLDTGDDTRDRMDLMLLGSGKVGRALVELIMERRPHFLRRFGLEARIVALADRSGYLLRPSGIPAEELLEALSVKNEGRPLVEITGARPADHPVAMVRDAMQHRLVRPVLVDVTNAADAGEAMLEALAEGCDVATANKIPLAGSYALFQALRAALADGTAILRSEATVGAGLPIIDTLEMLVATGDRLTGVEGCFSGTLGFVMTRIEEGVPLSEAVAEAEALGYTEPDPVEDLAGADVARKALILARISGLVSGEVPVELEGLVSSELLGLPKDELYRRLREYDRPMAEKAAAAKREGKVLRFMAKIERGKVEVGLMAVPTDSPPGSLHGTDNLVLFRSERYDDRPLVVVGPGAGIPVTAMGVLTDIARIAAERRPA